MAVKDRSQLLTDNASVFGNGKNTRGDDEKEFNDDQLDSVVMKSGDTFTAGAEFEFDNASKLREGTIDHGYGGGIARVCANEKTDQWEDGFRYLISTSGSSNTVIYAENINGTNPGSTDDVTQSYAVGSRWKNLVSGIEYICTVDTEDAAVWIPMSGDQVTFPTWNPTVTPDGVNLTAADFDGVYNFFRVGNIVTVNSTFVVTMDFLAATSGSFTIDPATLPIPSTTPNWRGVGQPDSTTTWPINCYVLNDGDFVIQSGSGAAEQPYTVFFTFSYSVN
jgi:hypothetical protein